MPVQNKDPKVNLPYIDEMLEQWDSNGPARRDILSQNMHFGFWSNPASDVPARSFGEFTKAMEDLTNQALRLAQVTSSSRIIDIGCGFGGTINRLNQTLENAQLIGLNIDPRQIELAKQLCGKGIRGNQISFTVADAQDTRLPADSFDNALVIECLVHIPNREQFLREMFRVLKPGGTLFTTEIVIEPKKFPLRLLDLLFHFSVIRKYVANVGTIARPGTTSSYKRLARKIGFEISAIEDWSRNILPTFASLKVIKKDEGDSPRSLYSPQLLDFGALMLNKGAHRYLAIRFRKPA